MNILRKASLLLFAASAIAAAAFNLDLPTETINGKTFYVYRVASKETVYSITRKLGITRDELIAANPAVADGLRAGETLLFPADAQEAPEEIAEVGVVAENPEGSEDPEDSESAEISEVSNNSKVSDNSKDSEVSENSKDSDNSKDSEVSENSEAAEPADSLSVAVILPFMLESENLTKSADNFTNFYRGFLLGIDSLSAEVEMPVKILVFDSEGTDQTIASLLSRPEVVNADFIIAPDSESAINSIVCATDSTDALLINLFAVKNNAYKTHESAYQGNISHDLMYETAIKGFCEANRGKKVIVLNATDIPADNAPFVAALTAKLIGAGIPFEQIDYAGKLTEQDLAQLTPAKDYTFIPTAHSREALMRILPALEQYRLLNQSASLFGYPQWITLNGDIKERLHQVNTTIYSRFASNPDSPDYKRVAASFENAYGSGLDKSTPCQALLGFDTAAWILRAAVKGTSEPYEGIQNSFKFIEIDGGGNENSALYFINFNPSGSTDVKLL